MDLALSSRHAVLTLLGTSHPERLEFVSVGLQVAACVPAAITIAIPVAATVRLLIVTYLHLAFRDAKVLCQYGQLLPADQKSRHRHPPG